MKPEITAKILKMLWELKAEGYEYIARDCRKYGGELATYKKKPIKEENWWNGEGAKFLDANILKDIKFSDAEPRSIDSMIKSGIAEAREQINPAVKENEYINPALSPEEYRKAYQREYHRKYYQEHREKIGLKNKERYHAGKEARLSYQRQYYQEHKKEKAEWARKNAEKYNAYCRNYYRRHREEILKKRREAYNQRKNQACTEI